MLDWMTKNIEKLVKKAQEDLTTILEYKEKEDATFTDWPSPGTITNFGPITDKMRRKEKRLNMLDWKYTKDELPRLGHQCVLLRSENDQFPRTGSLIKDISKLYWEVMQCNAYYPIEDFPLWAEINLP